MTFYYIYFPLCVQNALLFEFKSICMCMKLSLTLEKKRRQLKFGVIPSQKIPVRTHDVVKNTETTKKKAGKGE